LTRATLRLVVPNVDHRTVDPRPVPARPTNRELRTREYLTEAEVEALVAAARDNRNGHRDGLMILLGFRHGLRVAELVDLRWEQVDHVIHPQRSGPT
jgi:integrase